MSTWPVIGALAAGVAWLVGRTVHRRGQQAAVADAADLDPADDLSHLPEALQRSALWTLSDGGFERRVVRGVVERERADVAVTAFDLETLRERRGEWAYLPIEPPFRIAGVVSVAVCELDRAFPHVLLKRAGLGDHLEDDHPLDTLFSMPKRVRFLFGMTRKYPAELPATLPAAPVALELPNGWRAYTREPQCVAQLLASGFGAALLRAYRRDLVVELIDSIAIVYPAASRAAGADALADLTSIAVAIADAVRACSLTPRGIEA